MPYRDGSAWPGAGDDDMADFIVDVVQPFLTDAKVSGGLGWISQVPDGGAGGGGSHPNYQRLYSRGGVGTEAPPFFFVQTTLKTLWQFTGDDVDTTQQPYDQPGNPMNGPINASFGDPAGSNLGTMDGMATTTVIGPYENYWLFGGPTGEYVHIVLKVSAREYRHIHVGMLTPLDPDLDADTFYMTRHSWAWLDPDNLWAGSSGSNTDDKEHQPYQQQHHLPFRNNDNNNLNFGGDIRSCGMIVYSPNYGTLGYDFWIMTGRDTILNTVGRAVNGAGNSPSNPSTMTKAVGDVNNTADAVIIGSGMVTGYDKTLGTTLFACEPTFTTDGVAGIPILVMLPSDFESDIRWAPVGQVPDVFRVNMKTLDAEQEITIGSDTWTVFPMINKNSAVTAQGEGYSGYEGLAYKKITANAT